MQALWNSKVAHVWNAIWVCTWSIWPTDAWRSWSLNIHDTVKQLSKMDYPGIGIRRRHFGCRWRMSWYSTDKGNCRNASQQICGPSQQSHQRAIVSNTVRGKNKSWAELLDSISWQDWSLPRIARCLTTCCKDVNNHSARHNSPRQAISLVSFLTPIYGCSITRKSWGDVCLSILSVNSILQYQRLLVSSHWPCSFKNVHMGLMLLS